ncbi:MAG: alpha/beta hydrolase [Thermoleophilaceae bacterium]
MTVLHHEPAGAGRELLLVHAGVADMRMWEPQWGALAERFRVLRCDLRGFGGSPPGDAPYSHVGDLVELLDHVGFRSPAVIGASYGGKVAIDLALAEPERVSALVLAAPALADHDWSEQAEAFDAAEEEALERGDIDAAVELNLRTWVGVEALHETVAPMTRRAFELQLDAGAEELEPPAARLAGLRAPTLVLVGDRDLPDFGAIAQRIAAEAPGARTDVLPGAAHLLTMERPGEFLTRALAFLDSQELPYAARARSHGGGRRG